MRVYLPYSYLNSKTVKASVDVRFVVSDRTSLNIEALAKTWANACKSLLNG